MLGPVVLVAVAVLVLVVPVVVVAAASAARFVLPAEGAVVVAALFC